MSGILWGAVGSIGTFIVMAALGDMVSEEVRDRLDHMPHAILRLAAMTLAPEQRVTVHEDEWLPELVYILKGDEARPVTRLVHGTRYALGILLTARRITGNLHRTVSLAGAHPRAVPHMVPMILLEEFSYLSRVIHSSEQGSDRRTGVLRAVVYRELIQTYAQVEALSELVDHAGGRHLAGQEVLDRQNALQRKLRMLCDLAEEMEARNWGRTD